MTVFILGLRRSGTTAFWKMWRQDPRFVCYNEPFNPLLRRAGDPAWPESGREYREFNALYQQDPDRFWATFAPIDRTGELQDDLTDKQARYLAWLLAQGEHVCTDITRAQFKLESLHRVCPDAVVVHLYRPPANWVTSIVQPSTGHFERKTRRLKLLRTAQVMLRSYRFRRDFWEARDAHRFKGFDELIGAWPGSHFGVRLQEAGMDPQEVYAMPDVGRLLAFWKLHVEHVERDGPRLFGPRFVSVNFNDFCRDPSDTLSTVYRAGGLDASTFDVQGIHAPPPPYAADDPRWAAYARQLDLPSLT